jgi:hypothetical protein
MRMESKSRTGNAYDMSCGDDEHHDHGVLDDLIGRLFVVIEHEKAYDEKREIYA